MSSMNFGTKLARLLEIYRKPDGAKWSLKEIEDATDGYVTGRYLTNLKAGRIRQPSLDRLATLARIMGFPVELWVQNLENWDQIIGRQKNLRGGSTLANRLNLLFEVIANQETGAPFTVREVATLSKGRFTVEELERARSGEVQDLSGTQYLALSEIFGVNSSYWYSAAEQRPNLDPETIEALKNRKNLLLLNKMSTRSDDEKDLFLSLADQLDLLWESRNKDA